MLQPAVNFLNVKSGRLPGSTPSKLTLGQVNMLGIPGIQCLGMMPGEYPLSSLLSFLFPLGTSKIPDKPSFHESTLRRSVENTTLHVFPTLRMLLQRHMGNSRDTSAWKSHCPHPPLKQAEACCSVSQGFSADVMSAWPDTALTTWAPLCCS